MAMANLVRSLVSGDSTVAQFCGSRWWRVPISSAVSIGIHGGFAGVEA